MNKRSDEFFIKILIIVIALLSATASAIGILFREGPGNFAYTSIRNHAVTIYGKGVYRHMSAEVAPQGIAQDFITLFIAVPVLLVAFRSLGKKILHARIILTGILGYFLVTYTFYTTMGMYNELFLVYVAIMGCAFYGFTFMIRSFDMKTVSNHFPPSVPTRSAGIFLIVNSISIALLWLSIVVPPLLDGTIVPVEAEHYTTLIVQGFDLGILLPAAFISGILLKKRTSIGLVLGTVYQVFLSILMTALTAKVIAMYMNGYNVVPAICIVPVFNILAVVYSILVIRLIKPDAE